MSDENHPTVEKGGEKGERKGKKGGKGGKKGKGSKGGKKGGDKGRDDRPRFYTDKELEKEGRSIEELQADLDNVVAEHDKLEAETEELRHTLEERDPAELAAVIEKHSAIVAQEQEVKKGLTAEYNEIADAAAQLNKEAEAVRDDRKAAIDEKNRVKKERGLNYTEDDLKEAIRKLERDHETCGNLSRNAERKILSQLRELERIKGLMGDFRKYDDAIKVLEGSVHAAKEKAKKLNAVKDAKREEIKKVNETIKDHESKIENCKEGNKAEVHSGEQGLARLQKQRNAIKKKIDYAENKARYEADMVQYEKDRKANEEKRREEDKKWREERDAKRKEDEEHRMRTDEDYRNRKERQARMDEEKKVLKDEIDELKKKDPWCEERQLCANLISYLERATGKATTADKTAKVVSDKEKMEEALKKMQERMGSNVKIMGKDASEENDASLNFKLKKQDAAAARSTRPAGKKPVVIEKEKKVHEAISHTIDKFEAFDRLKVDTPMSITEAEVTLKLLIERKEWILTASIDDKMTDKRTKIPKKSEEKEKEKEKSRDSKDTHREGKGERKGKGGGKKGGNKGGKSRN